MIFEKLIFCSFDTLNLTWMQTKINTLFGHCRNWKMPVQFIEF